VTRGIIPVSQNYKYFLSDSIILLLEEWFHCPVGTRWFNDQLKKWQPLTVNDEEVQ
jgi:hypothetical protein